MKNIEITVETFAEVNRVLRSILSDKPKDDPGTKEGYYGNEDDAHYQGQQEVLWEHGLLAEELLKKLNEL